MLSIISDNWAKNLNLIPPKTKTTFYIDRIPSSIDSSNIYIQVEPESIIRVKDYLISNWRNFKYHSSNIRFYSILAPVDL
jgi:hypothetical protein